MSDYKEEDAVNEKNFEEKVALNKLEALQLNDQYLEVISNIIFEAQESFKCEDFDHCFYTLEKFLQQNIEKNDKLHDLYMELDFHSFLLHLLTTFEDQKNVKSVHFLILKCIITTVNTAEDYFDPYLKGGNDIIPILANEIAPPLKRYTSAALELLSLFMHYQKEQLGTNDKLLPLQDVYDSFIQFNEIIQSPNMRKSSKMNKSTKNDAQYNLLSKGYGLICIEFSQYDDISIDESNMIIEMASSIIGAEMEGSDHMMYALINLMDKNLFSLHEFKTHEIDTKLSNFFMVSNYYQSIAICDFLISFYDHGNSTSNFPIIPFLDFMDRQENTNLLNKIIEVINKVFDSNDEEAIDSFLREGGLRSIAKLTTFNANKNLTGWEECIVKNTYLLLEKAYLLLIKIVTNLPHSLIYNLTDDIILKSLVSGLEVENSEIKIGIYHLLSEIYDSFSEMGEEERFIRMFREEDGPEKLIEANLEEEDEIDAHNDFMLRFPDEAI